MSETTTTTPTARDKLIARAHDVPSLIAAATVADPALARALTGKALVASKSVYGPAVTAMVSLVVTRYGLGWDEPTCAMVSGMFILAASAAIRTFTKSPITGLITAPAPVAEPVTTGVTP